jgi:putative heme-binding domain-containing protein
MLFRRLELKLACCATFILLGLSCAAQTPAGSRVEGARRYTQFCAACHGADGRGGDKAASLATSQSVVNRSDAELFRIVRDGTPEGMPPFAQIGDANIVAVVHYLRYLEQAAAPGGLTPKPAITGDADTGRTLFFGKAKCSTCHMMQGSGGFIAGNLTNYARNRTADAILNAITNPDTPLAPTSRVVSITTRAGQSLTGVLRNEDNFSLALQTDDGRYHLFSRSDLTDVRYTDHSLMPRDYATELTRAELNDVVTFLIASSKAPRTDSEPGR